MEASDPDTVSDSAAAAECFFSFYVIFLKMF